MTGTTGATAEQVAAAKERLSLALECTTMSTNEVRFVVGKTGAFAAALVPAGCFIGSEEDRAAIGRALAYIRTHLHANDVPVGGNLLEDHLARWAAFDAVRDDVTEADLAALERLAGTP